MPLCCSPTAIGGDSAYSSSWQTVFVTFYMFYVPLNPPQPPFFNTTWASPHTREYIRQADVVVCLLQILKISGNPFRLIWCLHKQKGLHGRRQHKHSSWSKCLLLGLFAQEVVRGKKDSTGCLLKHWPNMCLNYQTDSISKRPQFEVVDALLYI